jgi:hypothetical protein
MASEREPPTMVALLSSKRVIRGKVTDKTQTIYANNAHLEVSTWDIEHPSRASSVCVCGCHRARRCTSQAKRRQALKKAR